MSLKGKIEAIIYAAEEPVTLAQLASLLGLEAQAELDHRAAQQPDLPLDTEPAPSDDGPPPPAEPDDLNAEVLDPAEVFDPEDPAHLNPEDPAALAEPGSTPAEPTPAEPTPEDRRRARDRDRAVRQHLRAVLDELIRDYLTGDRGLEIREVASGFRLATKPEYHDAVRGFARSLKPPLKLTLQALETLAVVAYKQPITAPEVAEIRGVDSAGVLGSLMARKLVTTAGRKQVVGRPILYKTTKDFLLRFGLRDVNELPSIEEFERMAGELADTEPTQEEIPMSPLSPDQIPSDHRDPRNPQDVTSANLREEADVHEPQADGVPSEESADSIPVDGRISGPPPTQDAPIDSPAGDAAIQADQNAAENSIED